MVTRLCRTAINSCCRAATQLALVRQRRLLTPVCCCLLLVLLLPYQLLQQQRWPAKLLPTQSAKRVGPINPDQPSRPYHDDFEYLLNPAVCGADGEPVYAVVVVHSDPRHPEVRQAIRDSLPAEELAVLGVKRAFMLADASTIERTGETTIPQRAIVEENAMLGDLVQGNFHDSYYNLTLKHIMALDWAATFCPQARYIVKMDDDIVYNVYELMKVLQLLSPSKYLGGNLFPNSRPYRGISKWHVSYEEWPRTFYPPYLSGWLYIITQDVARALVLQSTVVPFFWIDDLFVTGVLSEHLPFTIRGLNNLFVTSADCANYTVKQHFSEDQPSDEDVYSPNFVVGPTDHDLEVLKAFNRLCSYCERRLCRQRSRLLPLCGNNL